MNIRIVDGSERGFETRTEARRFMDLLLRCGFRTWTWERPERPKHWVFWGMAK